MIESIEFTNYKALRKTTLPLAPFTLLLGPNGSGKSSVLDAIANIAVISKSAPKHHGISVLNANWVPERNVANLDTSVEIRLRSLLNTQDLGVVFKWVDQGNRVHVSYENNKAKVVPQEDVEPLINWLTNMQVFALEPRAIAGSAMVNSNPLQRNGGGLAAVLDHLRDKDERWNSLKDEMRRWLPEYTSIEFDTPRDGHKSISLVTKKGGHRIPATALSQGTLVSIALLTLAYMPNPPTLVALEEIDRGLHPRLLRHLQDALYRLAYPESCGETRPPIQVIATTHSPYLLDLYRDHPEEVVLAEKEGLDVQFKRLTDIEHYEDILGQSPLSEVWYSGVLGGVSVKP